jgi:hypothetical protein
MADNTKRDAVLVVAAIGLTAVLVATWVLIQLFIPSDPRDPLTKAGGLKPEQDIRTHVK